MITHRFVPNDSFFHSLEREQHRRVAQYLRDRQPLKVCYVYRFCNFVKQTILLGKKIFS